ncbi:Zinc (Zn2)-Iron (Fe2) Permease (ZIP) Family [Thraustotheca clavata]|uniref:Zinc (Zn2)-Iron (Fe2) Permease (ZIP) Family n=1 Tax=Thraustotheca clavata TaxID=74557 RepID=A0A1V9ZXR2_9STRA|nr:Zinc (Zn2)-Iron (Fe2) Permease (ZIP) Family [Thraustotheca clavata]
MTNNDNKNSCHLTLNYLLYTSVVKYLRKRVRLRIDLMFVYDYIVCHLIATCQNIMIEGANPVFQAFLGTLVTWGLTAVGSAMVFVLDVHNKELSQKILDTMLGFAAGVMLAASYWSLLAPAIEIAEESPMYGPNGRWAFVPAAIGFALGAGAMLFTEHILPLLGLDAKPQSWEQNDEKSITPVKESDAQLRRRKKDDDATPSNDSKGEHEDTITSFVSAKDMSFRRVVLLVIAITMHNFPEGMAVGVGFGSVGHTSSATFGSAVNLALGIGLQNFPEGLAVSMPLRREGMSPFKAFMWGQLSGLVEPVGGLLGAVAVVYVQPILPYALSFAAGAMIFVVVDDLIPEAHQSGNAKLATIGTIFGFIVMMTMDVALAEAAMGVVLPLRRLETTHEEMMLQSFKENPEAVAMGLKRGQGVHSVEIFLGGQKRLLIVDTGSADTAFPCSGCTGCGTRHTNPVYKMGSTAKYISCQENIKRGFSACKACLQDTCQFREEYVEGSGWTALKVQDIAYFDGTPDLKANLVFGCMSAESGAFLSQSADGIMGMSRDPDAVHVQFYEDGATKIKGFSQCIAPDGGTMVIGGIDASLNDPADEMVFTPLRQTGYSYWTVSLETITVGGKKINVDPAIYNANRGCVFDSGTTFVYIPSAAKVAFQEQWQAAVGDDSPYSIYTEGVEYSMSSAQIKRLPTLCFTFANDATMCLPPTQYMINDFPGVYTATIFFQDFAKATIIGASMLENHNILYDMDNHRIGFVRANCDRMSSVALVTTLEGDTFTPEWSFKKLVVQLPSLTGFVLGIGFLLLLNPLVNKRSEYKMPSKNNSLMVQENLTSKCKYNQGRWTTEEHNLFLDGLRKYGRQWYNVVKLVKTRSVTQIRTHAQKYFVKQEKALLSKRTKVKWNKVQSTCLDMPHARDKKITDHLSIIPSYLKQAMTQSICGKLKLLINHVAAFIKQETKEEGGSIHLSQLQIAIENNSYLTLDQAILALLVHVKSIGNLRIALQAQRVVLTQLPILFLPTSLIQVPKLNYKLPPLAQWAPSMHSYDLWNQNIK